MLPWEEMERSCNTRGGMETLIHFVWYGERKIRKRQKMGADMEREIRIEACLL